MISFLENHSIYIVLVVVLMIWTGLFVFIFNLDKKVSRLESELNQLETNSPKKSE